MRRARAGAVAVLAAAAVVALGCGGGEVTDVRWDLSEPPAMDDVAWPEDARDLDAADIAPVGDVRLALPGGRSFAAPGATTGRVSLTRAGNRVEVVALTSEPQTVDDAVALAREWSKGFDLPVERIDEWARRARRDPRATGLVSAPRRARLGPDGPVPSIELRYSFDEERTALVALNLFWDAGGPGP